MLFRSKEIMKGGADKVKEANALLVGGHSIEDDEPKYGLSVMGLVHPKKIWRNVGACVGDVLILTKPIGLGIITTALKAGMLSTDDIREATTIMSTLNKIPAEYLIQNDVSVHACTDITGFGLMGHMLEMAQGSDVSMVLNSHWVPYVAKAIALAEMGIIPGGMYKNKAHCEKHIWHSEDVSESMMDLLYDPQTSGGLLISVPKHQVDSIISGINDVYALKCVVIGEVVAKDQFDIYVK